MEKSSKRGKIPQQDWPSIIARYEAGETLASIARTYDCSPPAISYIVSRTKARSAAAEAAVQTTPATSRRTAVAEGAVIGGPHKQHTCRCNVAWHGGNGRSQPIGPSGHRAAPDRAACRRAATERTGAVPRRTAASTEFARESRVVCRQWANSALRSYPARRPKPSRQRQRAACIGSCRGAAAERRFATNPAPVAASRKRRPARFAAPEHPKQRQCRLRRPFQSASDRAIGRWPTSTAGSDRSSSHAGLSGRFRAGRCCADASARWGARCGSKSPLRRGAARQGRWCVYR